MELPALESPAAVPPVRISRFVGVLVVLLIPCFWHHRIQAGDLGSHVYNAWLAMLAEKGSFPGVYVVTQFDNVLFDLLLFYPGKWFGLAIAEKLAVGLCVLIFFSGVFLLIRSLTARNPWPLVPALAALTYGYVFHMGFFNYYLSLGLACLSLALVFDGRKQWRIAAVTLLPLVFLAHPLGLLLFLGVAAYVELWRRVPRLRVALPIAAVFCVFAAREYLVAHPSYEFEWPAHHFYFFNGADQLLVFGDQYQWLYYAAEFTAIFILSVDLFTAPDKRKWWKDRALLLELYGVSIAVTAFLPESFRTNADAFWVGLLVSRLSLVTGIFALCLLNAARPMRWHAFPWAAIALAYFALLYRDTGLLDRMERNADRLVANLPAGTRVLKTIIAPEDWNVSFIQHSVERACVYHCISFSNYEPMSGQFRVRAHARKSLRNLGCRSSRRNGRRSLRSAGRRPAAQADLSVRSCGLHPPVHPRFAGR